MTAAALMLAVIWIITAPLMYIRSQSLDGFVVVVAVRSVPCCCRDTKLNDEPVLRNECGPCVCPSISCSFYTGDASYDCTSSIGAYGRDDLYVNKTFDGVYARNTGICFLERPLSVEMMGLIGGAVSLGCLLLTLLVYRMGWCRASESVTELVEQPASLRP